MKPKPKSRKASPPTESKNEDQQPCGICHKPVTAYPRYPRYLCRECAAKASDANGRKLQFGNIDFSGGYEAGYADTDEPYNSHQCYVDGIECRADEARFGGIVIEVASSTTRMDKHKALAALARKRQRARWPGYKGIGDYHGGAYECLHVSPYTKSAGKVDSPIMVFLQDWTSDESIRRGLDEDCVRLGHTPALPTNRNLKNFLAKYFGKKLEDIYATNLFPFIKPKHMGHAIPRCDLVRAAVEFGLPQIEIVRPRLVICLGLATFNALREACKLISLPNLASAIQSPFNIGKTRVWCQAHTGGQGQAMRNSGRSRVPNDWRRMKHGFTSKA